LWTIAAPGAVFVNIAAPSAAQENGMDNVFVQAGLWIAAVVMLLLYMNRRRRRKMFP
jgi:hypothetical protein